MIGFLRGIGLEVRLQPITGHMQLAGLRLEAGVLTVDKEQLRYPADMLHEAGHIAVVLPATRAGLTGDTGIDPAIENAVIAWSWAAAVHLGIDAAALFHADGYRGMSASILENFRAGRYVGVPMLRFIGLTGDAFPVMLKWLRE